MISLDIFHCVVLSWQIGVGLEIEIQMECRVKAVVAGVEPELWGTGEAKKLEP